jgi:quinol-cytochrome oxidoreductase complex cytochrome b subunit
VLFIFPFLTKPVKNPSKIFILGHKFFSWLFFINFWLLTWLGGQLEPYVLLSQVCISYYFLYFLVIIPLLNYYERWRSKNKKNNKNEKDKN